MSHSGSRHSLGRIRKQRRRSGRRGLLTWRQIHDGGTENVDLEVDLTFLVIFKASVLTQCTKSDIQDFTCFLSIY